LTTMRKTLILIAISIVLAACASMPNRPGATPTQSAPAASQTACLPSQTKQSKTGIPEAQGTMKSDGEMWALLFFDKAYAGKDEKIVWRITGIGKQFDAQAQHEDGTIILPSWVDYHGGSSWERPGDEWGTGFNFPKPGCWTLTITRGTTIGEIRLDVLAQ
jgi:hypothetical protein